MERDTAPAMATRYDAMMDALSGARIFDHVPDDAD